MTTKEGKIHSSFLWLLLLSQKFKQFWCILGHIPYLICKAGQKGKHLGLISWKKRRTLGPTKSNEEEASQNKERYCDVRTNCKCLHHLSYLSRLCCCALPKASLILVISSFLPEHFSSCLRHGCFTVFKISPNLLKEVHLNTLMFSPSYYH